MATSVSSQLSSAKGQGRLLVCLDRSAASQGCLPHAISLARTFENAVTLVHVMQQNVDQTGAHISDAMSWEIARQEARAYLARLQQEVSQSLRNAIVDVRLEQGRPADRIVDLAREIEADFIVLGNRGEGGTPAWALGSTAQQVLSVARASVFVAHSQNTASTFVEPKRILLPLDGSLRTESVIPTALRIAKASGAELLLVHVVQEPLSTALFNDPQDMELAQKLAGRLEMRAKRYLEKLQHQLLHQLAGVRILVLRHANEHQCLLELSQKEEVDLITLSAHGSACDSARSFGSVTAYLLTHSKTPILVLQDIPETDASRANEGNGRPAPRVSYAPETV